VKVVPNLYAARKMCKKVIQEEHNMLLAWYHGERTTRLAIGRWFYILVWNERGCKTLCGHLFQVPKYKVHLQEVWTL
jgi:hypothetical protein